MTMMTKKTPSSKRTNPPRDVVKTDDFIKDWKKLSHSGKHDMKVLKEVMMLLIADDAPLSPEWKDHKLTGKYEGFRECHAKGDLLLIEEARKILITFVRAGIHSELLGI